MSKASIVRWVKENKPRLNKQRRMSELKYIRLAKTKPCTDCGISYPYYVMQFDHRNKADKSFNLACRSGSNKGYQAIIAEIAKCDVVCANCHAIRTYVQNIKKE